MTQLPFSYRYWHLTLVNPFHQLSPFPRVMHVDPFARNSRSKSTDSSSNYTRNCPLNLWFAVRPGRVAKLLPTDTLSNKITNTLHFKHCILSLFKTHTIILLKLRPRVNCPGCKNATSYVTRHERPVYTLTNFSSEEKCRPWHLRINCTCELLHVEGLHTHKGNVTENYTSSLTTTRLYYRQDPDL